MNLQSQDKHRDIDFRMDGHIKEAKKNTVNFNLQPEDFDETEYDSETPDTAEIKQETISPQKRTKSAGKIEIPKSREKCLAVLVEAV